MPQLQWDELDLLTCLGVVPEVEEYGVEYRYRVEAGGHVLVLTIWPLESVAAFSLLAGDSATPLVEWAAFVRGPVRHVNDKRGEYLEFQDSVIGSDRFWHLDAGDVFDRSQYPGGVTVELGVRPQIRIRFRRVESP
jgi:hypothetical protein